jgi:CheY-like chemotaxis protein
VRSLWSEEMTTEHPVLIVEDDTETREAMKFFLEAHGYAAVLAADGAEGLARLRAGLRPCLILLDLMMPQKNGFQFRVEQVLDPDLSEIPVVVYSGNPDAHASGAALGAVTHLSKPLDLDKLLDAVRTHWSAG